MFAKQKSKVSNVSLLSNSAFHPKHHIDHYMSYSNFSSSHQYFVATLASIKEPSYFSQAVKDPQWVTTMNKELDALESNHTWTLVELSIGKQTVSCKWVYKIKYQSNGHVY